MLTREDYERVLRAVLTTAVKPPLSPQQADGLIASRWPLCGVGGCVNESYGRGIVLHADALADYFRHYFTECSADEVQDLIDNLHCTAIWPETFEAMLAWAIENGKAKLSDVGAQFARRPGAVDDMCRRSAAMN